MRGPVRAKADICTAAETTTSKMAAAAVEMVATAVVTAGVGMGA